MIFENPDRRGYNRNSGYRQCDYTYCPLCLSIPEPDAQCPSCGGYGEVPVLKRLALLPPREPTTEIMAHEAMRRHDRWKKESEQG